jgi:hypothetical protein
MDSITEAIAHFIGLFNVQTELARLREQYDEFKAQQALENNNPQLSNIPRLMDAPHQLAGFDPKLHYQSLSDPAPPPDALQGKLGIPAAPGSMPAVETPLQADGALGFTGGHVSSTLNEQEATLDPPDSLAVLVKQDIKLGDDDYLNTEGIEIETEAPQLAIIRLADLAAKARELDPLNHDADLSSEEGIADFIAQTRERVSSIADAGNTDAEIHVERANAITGTFVNGKTAEAAPDLVEYLPEALRPASAEPETADEPMPLKTGGEPGKLEEANQEFSGETAQSDDRVEAGDDSSNTVIVEEVSAPQEPEPEMTSTITELSTGANLLVNEVLLVNNWTVSPVIAVSGDSIHLDIISQTNVWSDHDRIDDAPPAQTSRNESPTTTALSIASFTIEATTPESDGSAPDDQGLLTTPSSWVVTKLDGNLTFMNWIEQFSLISDNDTVVLSNSGSDVMLSTGGNNGFNGVSLFEFGKYFDFIVVDGDYYHANIISQTNVLLDDDTIKSAPGHNKGDKSPPGQNKGDKSPPGQNKADKSPPGHDKNSADQQDTGGNLLWNQASIHRIGQPHYDGPPGQFIQTAKNFADGSYELPPGLLDNEIFAGLEGLRILHVSGDLLDLQYIRQTNILGDADQVILAGKELYSDTTTEWLITTGDNALVNMASIVDSGVDSNVYVSGNQYSDALLYQAELISDKPLHAKGDLLALANEAVAFLADDLVTESSNLNQEPLALDVDPTPADVMQTMLG